MRPALRGVGAGMLAACLALAVPARAALREAPADLAQELQNPIADLGNLVLENRADVGAGRLSRSTLNVVPIIPFDGTRDLTLISRSILPVISARAAAPSGATRTGLGDATTALYLSGIVGDWLLGAGPALRAPTATETELGRGKWSAGPAWASYRRDGPFTWGTLATHLQSFAGRAGPAVSVTILQPSVAFTTPSKTTLTLASETSYDWTARQWFAPLDANASQLLRLLGRPISIGVGGRVVLARLPGGADWALRCTIALPAVR